MASYLAGVDQNDGDHQRFHGLRQPAYIHHNTYANGAAPYDQEKDALVLGDTVAFTVVDEGAEVYLETDLPEALTAPRVDLVTSADLPRVRFADVDFEGSDGSVLVLPNGSWHSLGVAGQTQGVGGWLFNGAGGARADVECERLTNSVAINRCVGRRSTNP